MGCLLKCFLCMVPLQIGISMLTGMYTMLALVMIIINGQEFLNEIEMGVIVVTAFTALIWLTWLIAFYGAYASSMGGTMFAIFLWSVIIIAWIALSVLTIVNNDITCCAGTHFRCPPSMWLFESGGDDKKPVTKKPVKPTKKTFRFNANYPVADDEYYSVTEEYNDSKSEEYNDLKSEVCNDSEMDDYDSMEDEYESITEEYSMKNEDYNSPKRKKNHGSAIITHHKTKNEASNIGMWDLKYVVEKTDTEIPEKNTGVIDDYKGLRRDVNSEEHGDWTFSNKSQSSGQAMTSKVVVLKKTTKKPPKGKENKLNFKHLIAMIIFLLLMFYSWLVLLSFRAELNCIMDCICHV